MKENFQERIEMLTIEARNQIQRSKASLRNVILFYVFIFLFLILYSAIISMKVRELADPHTAATILSSQLKEHIQPVIRERIKNRPRPYAALLASNTLPSIHLMIQTVSDSVQRKMERDAGETSEKLIRSLAPQLDRSLEQLFARENLTPEESIAEGETLFRETHEKAEKVFLREYSCSLYYTANHLEEIRKKGKSQLTKQENTEREFLLLLLYFQENERFLDMEKCAGFMEIISPVIRNLKRAK